MSADVFTPPANEVPRDRWMRPLIVPPGGGKAVAYTRCTTYVSALEDTYNLERWKCRMTALGLAVRPDLQLAVVAHKDDKNKLNEVCDQAVEAAQASAAANTGTALHALTEQLDRGELDIATVPGDYRPDVTAYQNVIAAAGVKVEAIEQFGVLDDLKVAGTWDRIFNIDGRRYIADLKGLSLDTRIPTPTGWSTMGALTVGDEVFDARGNRCVVTAKSDIKRIGTYKVCFDDGSSVICDSEHIWWTQTGQSYTAAPTAKPIGEIIGTLSRNGQKQHRVPVAGPLDLPDVDLPIDPYLLGCWLGDGANRGGTITKARDLFEILELDGVPLGVEQIDSRKPHVITRTALGLGSVLKEHGLTHNKHVPAIYLRAGTTQRLRLLQGLMDTDGCWNIARCEAVFSSTSKELALGVEELALSLGQRVNFHEYTASGFGLQVTAYAVIFTPNGINPFRLPRKADQAAASTKPTTRARRRVIVAVEPGPDVETACIAVDSVDRTYLCGDQMIPTHNTGSIEYGMGKIAMQLAVYSRCQVYDVAAKSRTPLDGVDQDRGIVIHLPAGTGKAFLWWVDIAAGWEAVALAGQVRAWRARKNLATTFEYAAVKPDPPTVDTDPLLARIAVAPDVTSLRLLWAEANPHGTWTKAHTAAAAARKEQLSAATA